MKEGYVSIGIPTRREFFGASCIVCEKLTVRVLRFDSMNHSTVIRLCVEHFDRITHLMGTQALTYDERKAHDDG